MLQKKKKKAQKLDWQPSCPTHPVLASLRQKSLFFKHNLKISHIIICLLFSFSANKRETEAPPPAPRCPPPVAQTEPATLLNVFPAENVQKLLQCLGVGTGSGSLAAGFGIILGCWTLGIGGGAWVRSQLTVGPAGGQGGVSAAAVPAG